MTVEYRHVSPSDVQEMARACRHRGADLALVVAEDRRRELRRFLVHYVFTPAGGSSWLHLTTPVDASRPEVPSLAAVYYPAQRFEREIRDLFGIEPSGHPDPRPLVKHAFWPDGYYPLRKDAAVAAFADDGRPFPFTAVEGEGVYEIPVGPVHAGVIEPGHFRFSVVGESVIDLKSRLYFTHKGTEKLFEGRLPADGVELAERISGDTSVGHALAYCQAVEQAGRVEAPPRARWLRVLLLELERLYNHVGDFGAIVSDTGFAIAQAHCLRIREQLLRINKSLTGSRLLRGALVPGGLGHDLAVPSDLPGRLDALCADFDDIAAISLGNTLVLDRLEGTGRLGAALARDYGVLGYVGRASGLDIDARRDHPFAAYGELHVGVSRRADGDVKARTLVRVDEIHESARLVRQACERLPGGTVHVAVPALEPFVPAFGVVEGWRGRIVHWLMGGLDGRLHRVKVVDPSFFNWPALSQALVGNIVPDFPLCNKSFNQSYSGNDA